MPIYHKCTQYSDEYNLLKRGLPTSSHFDKLITPLGKPSKQCEKYANHLIAERLLKRKIDFYQSPAMERGLIVETEAAEWYDWDQNVESEKIGFVTDDRGTMGCSPDRLVGDDGLLEIKCPLPDTQVGYLITGKVDRAYWPQLQGQLYITQRKWVDILAWHEHLPRIVIRVGRDKEFIDLLANQIKALVLYLECIMDKIHAVADRSAPAKDISDLSAAVRAKLEIVP